MKEQSKSCSGVGPVVQSLAAELSLDPKALTEALRELAKPDSGARLERYLRDRKVRGA